MKYQCVRYDSLLNRILKKDLLFNGDYTIDTYQNCEFGCIYCDSSIDKTIYVKTNAIELLKNEIRKIEKGNIIIGSVNDPYQKIENSYEITRGLLKIIKQYEFPCHILTKSDMILRDLDILTELENCMVTMSITTFNKIVIDLFEKDLPLPIERLRTIEKLSINGIKTGIGIIPILPYIVEDELDNIIRCAKEYKANYILHKHLEIKGEQKTIFLKYLQKFNSRLLDEYIKIYNSNFIPNKQYRSKIKIIINKLCKKYGLNNSI